ncbi:transposase [Endozoicomonas sp. ONNA2]|uniref:transposase n=1 Tax=Endozoicomonas sp. ONNA2 TaxID=2828741 RepID=UPI0021480CB4|nr:transposase [Endozoicomonas sp. ONNA2]
MERSEQIRFDKLYQKHLTTVKLLPVEYFMVTFTLPAQLRALAWQHQRQVYDLLLRIVADTLKQFGTNSKKLDADPGMTSVLHTRSRRLDYHPLIHFVVPGGGINTRRTRRKERRKLTGNYLFNGRNRATQKNNYHWCNWF